MMSATPQQTSTEPSARPSRNEALTVEDLQAMRHGALVELFETLPPPEFAEMHGEFRAVLLDQGGRLANLFGHASVNQMSGGRWLTKSFLPVGENSGHGYNSFRTRRGSVLRKIRMQTRVGPSLITGQGEAFHLEYRFFANTAALVGMRDEVRKLNENLYLGLGLVGRGPLRPSKPLPFALVGPPAPWVGADRDERK